MKIFGKNFFHVCEILYFLSGFFVGSTIATAVGDRSLPALNYRGRCGFGAPCDANRLSYGCEQFNDNFGLCWSECVGNLPTAEEASFIYEGWCYNINSNLLAHLDQDFFSGKVARVSRRSVENATEQDYKDYFDGVWLIIMTQTRLLTLTIKVGSDGLFMGRPISEFTTCKVDSDCVNAARTCSIGCGNKEEAKPIY